MKQSLLNRSRKVKILSQFFAGELASLEQLKRSTHPNTPLPTKDFSAMTDEELECIASGQYLPEPYCRMTDVELEKIIARLG